MRFDKLTIKSQEALARAQSLAREGQQEHRANALFALLEQEDGVAAAVLQKQRVLEALCETWNPPLACRRCRARARAVSVGLGVSMLEATAGQVTPRRLCQW